MIVQELKKKGSPVWDRVTAKRIAERIMLIMPGHVGEQNALSSSDLFKSVYGVDDHKISYLNNIALKKVLSQAINRLRKDSNCFIISKGYGESSKYFVAKTQDDANIYHEQANRRIKGLYDLKDRAQRSVSEKWHKQNWQFDKTEIDE